MKKRVLALLTAIMFVISTTAILVTAEEVIEIPEIEVKVEDTAVVDGVSVVDECVGNEVEPITEKTAIEEIIDEDSALEEPSIEEIIDEKIIDEEPTIEEIIDEEPIHEESVIDEIIDEEHITEEPAIDEIIDKEHITEEPSIDESIDEGTVAEEPVIEEIINEEPVSEEPVVDEIIDEELAVEDVIETVWEDISVSSAQIKVPTFVFAEGESVAAELIIKINNADGVKLNNFIIDITKINSSENTTRNLMIGLSSLEGQLMKGETVFEYKFDFVPFDGANDTASLKVEIKDTDEEETVLASETVIFEKNTNESEESVVEPIVEEPIVEEPVVEETIVEDPIDEETIDEEPVVEEPIIEEPIVEEPIVEEPIVEEPIVEEPIVEEPIVEEPIVEEPIVEEPIVEEPIVEEPVNEEPIVEEIVVEEPDVEEPILEDPNNDESIVEDEPLSEEIAAWAEEVGATPEMIERARNAASLDSLVYEDGYFVYVRTGMVIAYFDAETGLVYDIDMLLPVAAFDVDSNMLYPIFDIPEEVFISNDEDMRNVDETADSVSEIVE